MNQPKTGKNVSTWATPEQLIDQVAGMTPGKLFDCIWRALDSEGRCDGYGGAQYRRIRQEWFEKRCPPIAPFIVEEANRPCPPL